MSSKAARRRLTAVPALLLAVAAAVPALAESAQTRCLQAKSCAEFTLQPYRWPSDAAGRVVIPYLVNPGGQPTMTDQEVLGAVQAAMRSWQRANPPITFRFEGFTPLPPGVPDGSNVIGFSVLGPPAAAAVVYYEEGVVREADLKLDAARLWLWEECPQRDNACGAPEPVLVGADDPLSEDRLVDVPANDLQGILAHELGHWLSLGHPEERAGREQTMREVPPFTLALQTLGLGDVLRVRAAYPCGKCGGRPVVFAP